MFVMERGIGPDVLYFDVLCRAMILEGWQLLIQSAMCCPVTRHFLGGNKQAMTHAAS